MLLLDGGPSCVPPIAELPQPCQDHLQADRLRGVEGEGLKEHLIRPVFIEPEARLHPRPLQLREGPIGDGGRRSLQRHHSQWVLPLPLDLAPKGHSPLHGQPFSTPSDKPTDRVDVPLGVQAVARGRALW